MWQIGRKSCDGAGGSYVRALSSEHLAALCPAVLSFAPGFEQAKATRVGGGWSQATEDVRSLQTSGPRVVALRQSQKGGMVLLGLVLRHEDS